MFGVSMSEMALVGVVALVVVGPQKLPGMLRSVGEWVGKLRRMATEMRAQTGIDDILRQEGIDGVAELRSLLRGEVAAARQRASDIMAQNYSEPDPAAEYPVEGPDAGGALPDDLVPESLIRAVADAKEKEAQQAAASQAPDPEPASAAEPAPSVAGPSATETVAPPTEVAPLTEAAPSPESAPLTEFTRPMDPGSAHEAPPSGSAGSTVDAGSNPAGGAA